MHRARPKCTTRRDFLAESAALAASGFLGFNTGARAEPPPEITRIRTGWVPVICLAPQYVAQALLKAEGFDDIQYVEYPTTTPVGGPVAAGIMDISLDAIGPTIVAIDEGAPISILGGIHLGCYELFAAEGIKSVHDLKHKTVPIDGLKGPQHVFLSSMAAYVGLDPRVDIHWEVHRASESMRLYQDGKVDAYLGFPPEPQELRAKGVGRVIVNTAVDKPWSQYYCCMLVGNKSFLRKYPVASKRAMRAFLKAADLCATDPQTAARIIVDSGFTKSYDYALETIEEVNYRGWRTYDPENAMRFHSVRLYEIGMIKSAPQQIISRGTDWRFLMQLKQELKL